MPYTNVEKFTFIEQSQKSVEESYGIIEEMIDKEEIKEQPEEIVPKVMCEETQWVEEFGSDE